MVQRAQVARANRPLAGMIALEDTILRQLFGRKRSFVRVRAVLVARFLDPSPSKANWPLTNSSDLQAKHDPR
jgi:hypothetical protein